MTTEPDYMNELILAFDTETTGLIDWALKDLHHASQPRIASLAAVLFHPTEGVVDEMNVLIKPDGWFMPPEAAEINGLTTERLKAEGIPMPVALKRFNEMKAQAKARLGFNISFDKQMLCREAHVYGIEHNSEGLESICVMQLAKPIAAIPFPDGKKGIKTPKLTEAYLAIMGKPLEGAHGALADTRAAMDLYLAILDLQAKEAA